jgi:hypothetical protein
MKGPWDCGLVLPLKTSYDVDPNGRRDETVLGLRGDSTCSDRHAGPLHPDDSRRCL